MPLRTLRELKARTVSLRGPLTRTGVFVLAWAFLPWWLFVPVALYLYFVPAPQIAAAAWLFAALMVLCLAQPPGWLFAGIFAALFFYLLAIKDLYIIDRRSAYGMLSLALVFLLFRAFYLAMDGHSGILVPLYAFLLAALFAGIVSGATSALPIEPQPHPLVRRAATLGAFLLFFQLAVVGMLLPLNFLFQSLVVFLFAALILEFFPAHLAGSLSRTKALATVSILFVLLSAVLGSARWGL